MSEKKKLSFPSAYTVLFIVLILATLLTWIIPAGKYDTLSYDTDNKVFVITHPDESTEEMEATQATLDKLNIKAELDKFTDGTIYKPMAITGTYQKMERHSQGFFDFIMAPIQGVYEVIDIILFIFMIGGMVGIVNFLGVFNEGIEALARVSKGREQVIIALVCFLIALGGTSFGMCEETIAFYPILVPIFLKSGYDAMVGVAAIWMGSCIGCMFSTVNPFSVVIASNAAGINFREGMGIHLVGLIIGVILTIGYILRYARKVKADPSKSIIYESKQHLEEKFLSGDVDAEVAAGKMRTSSKIILFLFFCVFVVMIYGVVKLEWWFGETAALFMCAGVVFGIIGRMSEKDICRVFIGGASDLVGVALVCGLARGVNYLMENGMISDTLLHTMSGWVKGMNPIVFICVMMVIYIILGFFINSSSGLAMLSIPIMAPLADAVGLPRSTVISAYIYGLGLIGVVTPTGLILPVLEMIDTTYNKWLKFIWPLCIIYFVFGLIMLIAQVMIG